MKKAILAISMMYIMIFANAQIEVEKLDKNVINVEKEYDILVLTFPRYTIYFEDYSDITYDDRNDELTVIMVFNEEREILHKISVLGIVPGEKHEWILYHRFDGKEDIYYGYNLGQNHPEKEGSDYQIKFIGRKALFIDSIEGGYGLSAINPSQKIWLEDEIIRQGYGWKLRSTQY
jgi:hypothetical protein